jgi:hypothetical protein
VTRVSEFEGKLEDMDSPQEDEGADALKHKGYSPFADTPSPRRCTADLACQVQFDKRVSDPYQPARAQVAELVDALASGASGCKVVKVRVLSWAPFH